MARKRSSGRSLGKQVKRHIARQNAEGARNQRTSSASSFHTRPPATSGPLDPFATLLAKLGGSGLNQVRGVYDASFAGNSVSGSTVNYVVDRLGRLPNWLGGGTGSGAGRPTLVGSTAADLRVRSSGTTWLETPGSTMFEWVNTTDSYGAIVIGTMGGTTYPFIVSPASTISPFWGFDARTGTIRGTKDGTFFDLAAKNSEVGVYLYGQDGTFGGSSQQANPYAIAARVGNLRKTLVTAPTGASTGGHRMVWGWIPGNPGINTDEMAMVLLLGRRVTPADMKLVGDYAKTYKSAVIPTTSKGVMFVGDSRTKGDESGTNGDYPFQLMTQAEFTGVQYQNLGVSGRTVNTMDFLCDAMVVPGLDPYLSKRVVVLMGGYNDDTAGRSPAQIYASFKSWVQKIRAADPTAVIVVVDVYREGGETSGLEKPWRVAFNTALDGGNGFPGIIAEGANYLFKASNVAALNGDMGGGNYASVPHLSAAGNLALANALKPTLQAALA